MKKRIFAALTALALLITPACTGNGSAGDTSPIDEQPGPVSSESANEPSESISSDSPVGEKVSIWDEPGEKELSISVCWDFYYIDEAAEKFKAIHPDVKILVNKYSNDYQKYSEQIGTALMAGAADDLLDGTGIQYTDSATTGLLADFYTLMNSDPGFNPDDFYTNVFDALAYKGGLYTFPTSFSYEMIGINNMFSETMTERFRAYSTINAMDILSIYNETENRQNYYIHDSFDVITAVSTLRNSFIDYESKTCDFNNQDFIDFITAAKNATEPGKAIGSSSSANIYPPDADLEQSKKYLFKNAVGDNYQYFMSFEEDVCFTDLIPLTNLESEVIMSPLKNFCISEKSENKELAWEFVKYLTTPEANEGGFVPSIPVNRELFKTTASEQLYQWAEYFEKEFGYHISGTIDENVDRALSIMDANNKLPMYCSDYDAVAGIIYEVLQQFADGAMTAEQTASELQNKISLILME